MTPLRVRNLSRGTELGNRIGLADRFWSRLRGLLGRRYLRRGEGILMQPCNGVRLLRTRFLVDVALVDEGGRVVATYASLRSGARTRTHWAASFGLQLPRGTLARTGTRTGDLLEVQARGMQAEGPTPLRSVGGAL